jgi:hypothetical protein
MTAFTLLIGVDDANRIHERSPPIPELVNGPGDRRSVLLRHCGFKCCTLRRSRNGAFRDETDFDITPSDDEFACQSDRHDALTGRSVSVPFGQSAIGRIFPPSHATSIMTRRAKPLPALEIPWQQIVDPLS